MNKFDYFVVGGLVIFLGIGANILFRDGPTQKEVNDLRVAMPALVKEDFSRLVKNARPLDGVPWVKASVLHTEPPFEDWYGVTGRHSLKVNVVAQRQDGIKFWAIYRVELDDRACARQPKNCASLDGMSVLEAGYETGLARTD